MRVHLSGLFALLTMVPRIKSIVNIHTVDPSVLCRVPVNICNGVPSDKHTFRLKGVEGAAGTICILLYGKSSDVYLRRPAGVDTGRATFHRGLTITAYRSVFRRLLAIIAHITGHKETFVFHYGLQHVALSQRPEAPTISGSSSDDNSELSVEKGVRVNHDRDDMKRPRYAQDAAGLEDFNFKFPIEMSFEERGVHVILFPDQYIRTYSTSSPHLRWHCSIHCRWKGGQIWV